MSKCIKGRMLILALALLTAAGLPGCSPSRKKVEKSKYYKELKEENKALKKEIKSLESKVEKENNISEDARRARDYLDKIARDHVIKMEIGYADNMEGGELIADKEAVFSMATSIAQKADECTKYTADQVAALYGPGYEYILYDEDNACYEIMVYGGNYVVFLDLPDRVYYAYDASALGEAFLHYRKGYPNSKLLHRFADTPFITDSDHNYYDRRTAYQAANQIDRMDKEVSSRKKAKKYWGKSKKGKSYTFYHHGNTMKMTLYDIFVRLENMDGKVTWYKASASDIDKIRTIFKTGKNPGKASDVASGSTEDEAGDKTHYEEMETEGAAESQEETTTDGDYYDQKGSEG